MMRGCTTIAWCGLSRSFSAEPRDQFVHPLEGNKRRVSDGSRNIFVSIEDPNFIRVVQTGAEAFRKGDLLHVQLQTRQWLEGNELKAEYSILKVYRHEPAPEQQKLQLSRNDETDSE